jgi:hypothetical protein
LVYAAKVNLYSSKPLSSGKNKNDLTERSAQKQADYLTDNFIEVTDSSNVRMAALGPGADKSRNTATVCSQPKAAFASTRPTGIHSALPWQVKPSRHPCLSMTCQPRGLAFYDGDN